MSTTVRCRRVRPHRSLPLLNGAVDNEIVKHLIRKFPDAGVESKQLEDIDRPKYEQLQSLVRREIREDFNSEIVPVHMMTFCSVV